MARKKDSFITDLNVSPQGGRLWKLKAQFTYEHWREGIRERITVPIGFLTDFASIPLWRLLFWWLPMWAKYNKAPVLHDYLYRKGIPIKMTRYEADYTFYEAMLLAFRNHKSGKIIAHLEYWGVRIGGWMSYKRRELC